MKVHHHQFCLIHFFRVEQRGRQSKDAPFDCESRAVVMAAGLRRKVHGNLGMLRGIHLLGLEAGLCVCAWRFSPSLYALASSSRLCPPFVRCLAACNLLSVVVLRPSICLSFISVSSRESFSKSSRVNCDTCAKPKMPFLFIDHPYFP